LPPSICTRLKAGENPIADMRHDVTVLFSHLHGFAVLTSILEPRALVGVLNTLFCAYDRLLESKGLEKIKTVGDAYMMGGNLLKQTPNAALLVVECGLEMLDILKEVNDQYNFDTPLQQSAGVNTGNVVAGVLGYTTVAFDIWGDAVNLASRMESTGHVGCVQVTPSTWALVKEHHRAQQANVTVKGKGAMIGYRIWPKGVKPPPVVPQKAVVETVSIPVAAEVGVPMKARPGTPPHPKARPGTPPHLNNRPGTPPEELMSIDEDDEPLRTGPLAPSLQPRGFTSQPSVPQVPTFARLMDDRATNLKRELDMMSDVSLAVGDNDPFALSISSNLSRKSTP
jgi:class 3 adenylate cyclase